MNIPFPPSKERMHLSLELSEEAFLTILVKKKIEDIEDYHDYHLMLEKEYRPSWAKKRG